MYWLEADYLEVAAAAAHCGAHFTALLYIEAWQEEQHGWLVPLDASTVPAATALLPGSGSAGSEGPSGAGGNELSGGGAEEQAATVEKVRRLLLDTYRQVGRWLWPVARWCITHFGCFDSHTPFQATQSCVRWLALTAAPSTNLMAFMRWRAPTACCPRCAPSFWRAHSCRTRFSPRSGSHFTSFSLDKNPCHVSLPPSAHSQLKRFEHEGDWSRALLSYDLVLQHLLAPAGSGPASGTQRQQQQPASQFVGTDPGGAFGSQFPAASQPPGGQPARPAAAASFEGISQQAAVAGLLRSLAQLGAGHLLQAYARSSDVPEAAAQAALSLGQWGQLGSSLTSGGGSGSAAGSGLSLDAALQAAVAGLQAGSMERCKQAVSGARRGLVASLVTASLEGAANVNPSLVQLQMLQAVSEAWELLWPTLPDLGSIGSPKKGRRRPNSSDSAVAAAAAAVASAAGGSPLLEGVLQLWQGREGAAGAGGRSDLQAPRQASREGRQLWRWEGRSRRLDRLGMQLPIEMS